MTAIEPAALAAVTDELERAGAVELAAELVRIPSHPGVDRQEEAVVRALERYLVARGLATASEEVAPGRPNLLARVGTAGGRGRHLLLCGHTDTVALNRDDPGFGFAGAVAEGMLQGRGAVDMKGALAAMAAALVALDRSRALTGGCVTMAAVVDEEMESLGAERLIRSRFGGDLLGCKPGQPSSLPDAAVVGEPTGNRIALGHKGLEWLRIDFHGRSAHGGTPQAGINAIAAAARFLGLVEEHLLPRFEARRHPLLGPPTFNAGTIRGGDQPSTVAAECTLVVDRRSVPGESFETLVDELRELLNAVEQERPGLLTSVARVPGGMATMAHGPLLTSPDHPLARAAVAACRVVRAESGPFCAFPAWTDGALLAAEGGLPTIVLGPGDLSFAHSPREAVATAQIEEAALIYAAIALAYCPNRQH